MKNGSQEGLETLQSRENLISLKEGSKTCQYSRDYLSLRARQGKLKAVKDGKSWKTTKEWLAEYIENAQEYKDGITEHRTKKTTRSEKFGTTNRWLEAKDSLKTVFGQSISKLEEKSGVFWAKTFSFSDKIKSVLTKKPKLSFLGVSVFCLTAFCVLRPETILAGYDKLNEGFRNAPENLAWAVETGTEKIALEMTVLGEEFADIFTETPEVFKKSVNGLEQRMFEGISGIGKFADRGAYKGKGGIPNEKCQDLVAAINENLRYPYESTNLYENTKDDETTTDQILNQVQDDNELVPNDSTNGDEILPNPPFSKEGDGGSSLFERASAVSSAESEAGRDLVSLKFEMALANFSEGVNNAWGLIKKAPAIPGKIAGWAKKAEIFNEGIKTRLAEANREAWRDFKFAWVNAGRNAEEVFAPVRERTMLALKGESDGESRIKNQELRNDETTTDDEILNQVQDDSSVVQNDSSLVRDDKIVARNDASGAANFLKHLIFDGIQDLKQGTVKTARILKDKIFGAAGRTLYAWGERVKGVFSNGTDEILRFAQNDNRDEILNQVQDDITVVQDDIIGLKNDLGGKEIVQRFVTQEVTEHKTEVTQVVKEPVAGPAGPIGPQGPTGPAGNVTNVNNVTYSTGGNTYYYNEGSQVFNGDLLGNSIAVSGDGSVGRNFSVAGDTLLGRDGADTLTVKAVSVFDDGATFNSSVAINDTLDVTGNTALGANLNVAGDVTLSDATNGASSLRIYDAPGQYWSLGETAGLLGYSDDLTVDASGTFTITQNGGDKFTINSNGDIVLTGNVSASSDFEIAGNLIASGTFAAGIASHSFGGDLTVGDDVSVGGDLSVVGNIDFGGTVAIGEDGLTIDTTKTEAFLVRKDGDSGDVFAVNSSNGWTEFRDPSSSDYLRVFHNGTKASLISSTGLINLGTDAVSTHSLTTGDVLLGAMLEVDGIAYFDAAGYFASTVSVALDFEVGNNVLHVNQTTGAITFGSNASHSFQGDLEIADHLTVNGTSLLVGDVTFGGAAFTSDGSGTIGTSSTRWNHGYFDSITADFVFGTGTDLAGTTAPDFLINSDNDTADGEDATLSFKRGSLSPSAQILWDSSEDRFDFNFPLYISSAAKNYFGGPVSATSDFEVGDNVLHVNQTTGVVTFGSTASHSLAGDVTVGDDLTIGGDLFVNGNIDFMGTVAIGEDGLTIDTTKTEAFLVRKDGDSGDVFAVNSSNGWTEFRDPSSSDYLRVFHNGTKASLISSTGLINLGTDAVSTHSLTTGDVLLGAMLEVDGIAYFDAAGYFASTVSVALDFEVGNNVLHVNQTTGAVIFGSAASHSFAGDLAIGDDLAVTGNANFGSSMDITTGNLDLDNTTNANQYGVITKNGVRFMHDFNYGNNGTVTTVGQNTFVGANAGNLTMGSTATLVYHASYNSVLGYNALLANTTGYSNSALGRLALYSNTTGHNNSALGHDALYSNTTGYNNSALGRLAGRYITDGSSPNQTSNTSLYLGADTKALANGDSNEIVIGYNATGLGSNTVVLGNDLITKTVLRGSVGIGTTEPSGPLDVYGSLGHSYIEATGNAFAIAGTAGYIKTRDNYGLYFQTNNTGRMVITSTGLVGIGTTAPASLLELFKTGANSTLTITASSAATYDPSIVFRNSTDGTPVSLFAMGVDTSDNPEKFKFSYGGALGTNDLVTITSAGYVGIGTTAPDARLAVSGGHIITDSNLYFGPSVTDINANGTWSFLRNGDLTLRERVAGSLNSRVTFQSGGQVGINTTSPDALLDVAGSGIFDNELIVAGALQIGNATSATYSRFGSDATSHSGFITASNDLLISGDLEVNASAHFDSFLQVGTNTLYADPATGRVGIGTTEPNYLMTIRTRPDHPSLIGIDDGSDATNPALYFHRWTGGAENSYGWRIEENLDDLRFSRAAGAAMGAHYWADMITFTDIGNVGIGTTNPASRLELFRTDANSSLVITASSAATYDPSIVFRNSTDGTPASLFAMGVDSSDDHRFKLSYGGVLGTNDLVTIASTGYLGLGTSSPSAKLDITTGNLDLDNTTNANQYGVITKNGVRFMHDFNYGNNGTVTTEGYNTFVGVNTGNLTMGSTAAQIWHSSRNTAIGSQALYSNTTGYYNSVLGYSGLGSNTSGSQNSAVGYASLSLNTTGGLNSALGREAGYNSQTGAGNTFLGSYAGRGTALYTGSDYNTLIGYEAGNNLGSNQDKNVFIGYQAGYSETGSNKLYLSNANNSALVYGDFSTGDLKLGGLAAQTSPFMTIASSGYVGIGTTEPIGKLHVYGADPVLYIQDSEMSQADAQSYVWFGESNTSTSQQRHWKVGYNNESFSFINDIDPVAGVEVEKVRITKTGLVGIGTIAPASPLELFKTGANSTLTITASSAATYDPSIVFRNSTDGSPASLFAMGVDSSDDHRFKLSYGGVLGTNDLVTIASTGYLGLGTSSPSAKLDITTGNLDLDNTTNANKYGVITKNGVRFMHDFNYGNNGTVTTDGYNTFVGLNAGNLTMGSTATSVSHASYNTAVGYNALNANTTGFSNSALGRTALSANTTGYNNSALGLNALSTNTTGYNNSALGQAALYANTQGYNNSALGTNAGRYIADGTSPNQTSNTSLYLGNDTKALANGGSNEIVIGYNATGLGSNTVVLGNDSITKTVLRGSVGIGTTAPNAKLEIFGSGEVARFGNDTNAQTYIEFSNNPGFGRRAIIGYDNLAFGGVGALSLQGGNTKGIVFNVNNSTFGSGTAMAITSTGLVGIGTTSPSALLDVYSASTTVPALSLRNPQDTATLGSELTTNGGFTTDLSGWTGTGWSWEAGTDGQAAHTPGDTTALTQNISVANGTTYQVEVTITGMTAGSVGITVGGVPIVDYGSAGLFTADGVYKRTLIASGTGSQALSITPTTTFDGKITLITVKPVTADALAYAKFVDNTGANALEIRGTNSLANTFVGTDSGKKNTTGHSNAALGYQSLPANTTGDSNSAMGRYSLFSNTTGKFNSAFGAQALFTNTTGINNTALGYYSLRANTTGNVNMALGHYSLSSNTVGSSNTALGAFSFRTNTTGANNSALGRDSGYYSQTGAGNTFLGYRAGYGTATYTGSDYNTIIGYEAGYNLGSNQDKNVFIGYQAGYSETGSNKLYLSNANNSALVYGDFSTGDLKLGGTTAQTSPFMTIASSSYVGIGTTEPGAKLTVQQDGAGNIVDFKDGSTSIFTIADGGTITVAGAISYSGSGKPKRTIVLTAEGAITPTTSGAAQTKVDGSNHSFYVLDYDASADESAFWHWTMPDSYDAGAIDVTFFWEAAATAGDVVWAAQTAGVAPDNAEDIDPALGVAQTVTDTAQANANDLGSATISGWTPGWAAGDYITFKTYRDADSGSDTMSGDGRLVRVKIEYSVGSESD